MVANVKTRPLVSVVIPTYNRGHVLGRTLESVFAQAYEPIEIIIVDDGSTDGTEEIIQRAYGQDPRIRYFREENGGPARARNTAFAHVRGEYIALLDSDDSWHPWKLRLQIACMEREPDLGMTFTDMETVDPSGKVVYETSVRVLYSAYGHFSDDQLFARKVSLREIAPELAGVVGDAQLRIGSIFSQMIMGNLVPTPTVILRRERLAKVGGFNEDLRDSGEDYDFHLRTCRLGPIGFLDLPALRYQRGMPDQLTARKYVLRIAENCLKTILPVITSDRASIELPDDMLKRRLAKAHAWIAFERLELGEAKRARAHYFESLRFWPWQPNLAKQIFFATLPGGVALRRRMQALKATLFGAPAPHL